MHKFLTHSFLIATVIVFVQCVSVQEVAAQVVINEVLPNPAATSDKSEWLELFNAGEETVDLRGWKIDDKEITAVDPVEIDPQGYTIVTKDVAEFVNEFSPPPELRIVQLAISLSNSGDTVSISNGAYSDSVDFGSTTSVVSWERLGPLCSQLVKRSEANSLGSLNQNSDESCFPHIPKPRLKIEFSLNQTDWTQSLQKVGSQEVYFRYVLEDSVTVQETIWKDLKGNIISSPHRWNTLLAEPISLDVKTTDGVFTYESEPITIFPRLRVNEVMPNPAGVDSGEEWVEIYNPNGFEIELNGLKLFDLAGEIHSFTIEKIAARGYHSQKLNKSYLLNCESDSDCNESVVLKFGSLVIDNFSYSESKPEQSWSRMTDGSWTLAYPSSPGKENSPPQNTVSKEESEKDDPVSNPPEKPKTPSQITDQVSNVISSYKYPSLSYERSLPLAKPELLLDFNPLPIFMTSLIVSSLVLLVDTGYAAVIMRWWRAGVYPLSAETPILRTAQV